MYRKSVADHGHIPCSDSRWAYGRRTWRRWACRICCSAKMFPPRDGWRNTLQKEWSSLQSYGWVLIHVSGQVSIKIVGIAETDELGNIFSDAGIDHVIFRQPHGNLPIHAQHSVTLFDNHADRSPFGEHHGAVNGKVR